ncbi:PhzF family phenazine biosynthesis protein [Thalassospira xianhensis]|uniref:PhzF family phenazine biosynthesis protein n=1 Tax=Thalassospira xianhensis TaxID=478503 RepID=UPI000DED4517|nr:PhzF family phenazine biosynthesis protein [Thalassospira xianhensis]
MSIAKTTKTHPYHIVDVFASSVLGGNPLAVVMDADDLSTTVMQAISREFNLSETTFLMRPKTAGGADWKLRSFTGAGVEVGGTGHNALGAWWLLGHLGLLPAGQREFTQEIGGRDLPVEVLKGKDGITVTMDQAPAEGRAVLSDLDALALVLGISRDDIGIGNVPVQTVYTGTAHLLVPMRSRSVITNVEPDVRRLRDILATVGAEGIYLFSLDPEDRSMTAHARFFNPIAGIVEDPATGSAAGPLAWQLAKYGYADVNASVRIIQGVEMDRPSVIRIELDGDFIKLSGGAVLAASGELFV